MTTGVIKQFKLPDVGEGLTEADIIRWAVKPGDTIVVNQTIVEVETAKAAVELPSPYAGVVSALHVAEGDTVPVGTAIISIEVPADGTQAPPSDQVGGAAEDLIPAPEQPDQGDIGNRPRTSGSPCSSAMAPALWAVRRRRRLPPPGASLRPQRVHCPGWADGAERTSPRRATGPGPSRRSTSWPRRLASMMVRPTGGQDGDPCRCGVSRPAEPARAGVAAEGGAEARIPVKGVRKHGRGDGFLRVHGPACDRVPDR